MEELLNELRVKPDLGTPLGGNVFKIRWQVKSKSKGKSGGVRIITYYVSEDGKLYLLSIYANPNKQALLRSKFGY
jgi:hypothetical protein